MRENCCTRREKIREREFVFSTTLNTYDDEHRSNRKKEGGLDE